MSARILVVEDNDDNRELMAYLLEGNGHRPVLASGGREGLDAARADPPDVILLDLHMPEVDGFEVVSALKADPALREVPVVAVTAVAMVGDREAILRLGFDGYVSKPIAPESFVGEIEAFLPRDRRCAAGSC